MTVEPMTQHPAFAALLDLAAGRGTEPVRGHVAACAHCRRLHENVERLVAAGRRARPVSLSTRARRRVQRIFRDHFRPKVSLLDLVLDSLWRPAPALRTAAAPARFLRFEGDVQVELEITPSRRGVDLRGQLTPAGYAREVLLTVAGKRRRARVAADGTFLLRGVPRREVQLEIGAARIEGLHL